MAIGFCGRFPWSSVVDLPDPVLCPSVAIHVILAMGPYAQLHTASKRYQIAHESFSTERHKTAERLADHKLSRYL